jgi:signal transduction histidine kinase
LETYDSGGALSLYALMKGQDKNHSRQFSSLRDQLVDGLRGLLDAKHYQQIDFDAKIAQQEVGFKRMIMIVAVGGTFHVVLAIFLWLNFSRGTAENFRILVDNTRRLAQGKPLNAPIEGGGEIAHLDHVFNDMAQALEAEKRKREEIEQMKQEFVAMISHDLRTPLTSVQACLTLLTTGMYGELSEQGTENVQMAEGNVTRLISLINDLLDIEKMESGKLKMELTGCSIGDVFDRSLAAVVSFAQQQQVSLVMERTDLRAIADGDRLVQVLVNLIANAIKFSPKDSQVTVSAQDKEEMIVVRVSDQGRGIPSEFRQSIFERFQQVKGSDAKVKGGSGLGLAICKAIIEGHSGEIGVDSEENKGSCFWFSVPKQSQLAEQHDEQPAAQPA